MSKTWLCADHHFQHKNIINFKRDDGSPLRDFASFEDMNEYMIDRHNSVVSDSDRVYMLGDIVIHQHGLPLLGKLKGRLVLIKGNHDIFKLKQYAEYFDDIRSIHKLAEFYLSHVPIHPESIPHWSFGNIHGHTHYQKVMKTIHKNNWGQYSTETIVDPRYHCVSMEQLKDYTPVEFEEIRAKYQG